MKKSAPLYYHSWLTYLYHYVMLRSKNKLDFPVFSVGVYAYNHLSYVVMEL